MGYWIFADDQPSSSSFYYFEKEFIASPGAVLKTDICADSRYQLYLNGNLVSEGPCQGPLSSVCYETEDLTPYLKEGKNVLFAKVLFLTPGIFNIINRKDRPGFFFRGTLSANGEQKELISDRSWQVTKELNCKMFRGPYVHPAINPFEEWQGESGTVAVPLIQSYQPDTERHSINSCGIAEKYILTPRPIPQMKTGPQKPFQIVRRGKGFIEFDAGVYTTAKFRIDFQAEKNSTVRIIYAECYTQTDENGRHYKGLRDDCQSENATLVGVYDILHATGEPETFSPFWYRAFRFIRLEYDSTAEPEIFDIGFRGYFYPLSDEGSFSSSDRDLNDIWQISRNTLMCCTHEKFVDCPYYEQSQYQMDSGLEMLYALRLSGDARIARKSLFDLAASQIDNGMLQANYPSLEVQVIPGFTLYWVLMLRDYILYCNDSDNSAVKDAALLVGTMVKAIESFNGYLTPEGLVGATPYWHFLDWVPKWEIGVPTGGREKPVTALSLLYATALNAGAEVSTVLGMNGLAADYKERAEMVINAVNKYCYDEKIGLYRDTPTTDEYSQHTTLWAVLSGAVKGEEARALIDRTYNTEKEVSICTFSMNYYMFRALEKAGRYEKYAKSQLAGWQKMLQLHCTTWCENPDSPRSECHGWSSAPIYEFSSMVLGVNPASNGYKKIVVKPYINAYDLSYAEGSVPTPQGVVRVRWEKKDRTFSLRVTLPKEIETTVILPDKTEYRQTELTQTYRCAL